GGHVATESKPNGQGAAMLRPFAVATLSFSEPEVRDFSVTSHDANPIHLDASYARRTPYGQPVVFGALAVLKCLERVDLPSHDAVRRIEAEFFNPIFVDVSYEVSVSAPREGAYVVELTEGELVLLKLRVFSRADALGQAQQPAGCSLRWLPQLDGE